MAPCAEGEMGFSPRPARNIAPQPAERPASVQHWSALSESRLKRRWRELPDQARKLTQQLKSAAQSRIAMVGNRVAKKFSI